MQHWAAAEVAEAATAWRVATRGSDSSMPCGASMASVENMAARDDEGGYRDTVVNFFRLDRYLEKRAPYAAERRPVSSDRYTKLVGSTPYTSPGRPPPCWLCPRRCAARLEGGGPEPSGAQLGRVTASRPPGQVPAALQARCAQLEALSLTLAWLGVGVRFGVRVRGRGRG